MEKKELTDVEYRKKIKKENFWYHFRIISTIIIVLLLIVSEIVMGVYLYQNDYPILRTFIVLFAWFFVYFITVSCIVLSVSIITSTFADLIGTDNKITKEDVRIIIYLVVVTIIMVGGSNFLFWHFAF